MFETSEKELVNVLIHLRMSYIYMYSYVQTILGGTEGGVRLSTV